MEARNERTTARYIFIYNKLTTSSKGDQHHVRQHDGPSNRGGCHVICNVLLVYGCKENGKDQQKGSNALQEKGVADGNGRGKKVGGQFEWRIVLSAVSESVK